MIFLPPPILNFALGQAEDLRIDFTGQYLVPCNTQRLPPLSFTIGGYNFTIEPEEYVVLDTPQMVSAPRRKREVLSV